MYCYWLLQFLHNLLSSAALCTSSLLLLYMQPRIELVISALQTNSWETHSVESTLDTMIAVLIAACFCITAMLILLDILLTYFLSVFATVPVHPITIGTTSVFIFHSLCTSMFRSW